MNRWHKLVLGLILVLPGVCLGQTPDQFTLQVQNGGVPVYTRSSFAALDLTGGCSGTVSGGALQITCTGGAANPGGNPNQIEYNVAGTSFGGFTMSGDCSIVVATGVITCTETNGTAFGPLATQATGSLSTGLAKVTTSTGLLSTAALGDVTGLFTGTGLLRNSGAASEISGDCTTSGSNAITCTKTNGTAFGTAATANLTNTTSFPFQSITTTGSSGAATLVSGVLNIPSYSGSGSGLFSGLNVTGANGSLSSGTNPMTITGGDYGASPAVGLLTLTDSSTTSTDTTPELYINVPSTSYHNGLNVSIDGFSQLQVCATGSGHAGLILLGSAIACPTLSATQTAKLWVLASSNTSAATFLDTHSSGFTGGVVRARSVMAAGSGFDLFEGCAAASGTDGSCSTNLFWVNGLGALFTPDVTITGAPSGSVVAANGTGYLVPYVSSLTTTGTSGAATVSGGVLNIPQYTGGGGGGSPAGSNYAIQYNNSSSFGGINAPTTPNLVPQTPTSTPTSLGAATAFVNSLPGLLGRPITGTTSSDTIQATDCDPARVEYVGSVSVAVTLPTATTLGVPYCQTKLTNNTTGTNTTVTVTPTTWTINGLSSLTLLQGQQLILSVDPNSSTNWVADQIEDSLVAGSNIIFTRTPNSGMTIALTSIPNVAGINASQATNTTSVIKGAITTVGYTGYLLELAGTPSAPADVETTDVAGNKFLAGSITVDGNGLFNGSTNSFPNGPISSGSTSLTATACPSTVAGAWCAAEGSTAGTPTTGVDYLRADATQHALLYSHNGGAETNLNSASALSTGTLSTSLLASNIKIRECDIALGNGLNAIPAGTYPIVGCKNDTGSTITITAVQCYMNSGSTSTCDASSSAGGSILTGAVTGSSTFAAGTQSSTTTLATGVWLNGSLVADGSSTQIILHVISTL